MTEGELNKRQLSPCVVCGGVEPPNLVRDHAFFLNEWFVYYLCPQCEHVGEKIVVRGDCDKDTLDKVLLMAVVNWNKVNDSN